MIFQLFLLGMLQRQTGARDWDVMEVTPVRKHVTSAGRGEVFPVTRTRHPPSRRVMPAPEPRQIFRYRDLLRLAGQMACFYFGEGQPAAKALFF